MNGNGGSGYSATPPLRETIYDLLYERDEHGLDGVRPTLQAFATCLGIQWMHVTPLSDLAKRILDTKQDTPTTCSPRQHPYTRNKYAS